MSEKGTGGKERRREGREGIPALPYTPSHYVLDKGLTHWPTRRSGLRALNRIHVTLQGLQQGVCTVQGVIISPMAVRGCRLGNFWNFSYKIMTWCEADWPRTSSGNFFYLFFAGMSYSGVLTHFLKNSTPGISARVWSSVDQLLGWP